MKKIFLVIGVAVVGLIVAAVIAGLAAKDKFEPLAGKVLTDCDAGKESEVYAAASAAFRKDVPLEEFRGYVDSRKRVLGAFRRVVKATGGGISASTDSGTIGTVSLTLEYEKGPADGEFKFVKEGGDWKLLHMKVVFDEKLLPPPDRAAIEPSSKALLALYDDSAFVALYARFSKPLQDAWKADAYEPQIRDIFAKAGRTTKVVLREIKDEGPGKVEAAFDVEFEKGPGDATFGWVWADAGWNLTAFNLHLGRR